MGTSPHKSGNSVALQVLLSVLLCVAGIATATAQQSDIPGVIVADAGNRIIYTAEYFSQYNVVTASDQLQRVPGVAGLGGGGGGGGDQRGFGSGGDQILINGNRVSGKSNDVGSVLQRIQARQVVQIEVIRGTVPGLDVRSQGRVVNVVLEDTLNTGYGSVAAAVEHYEEGDPGAGVELTYNGDLGAINYLFSVEGDMRRDIEQSSDSFYTPANILFERQSEHSRGRSEELAVTTNTSYTFLNGNLLNLNALVTIEDESGYEISNNFLVTAGNERPDDGQLNEATETSRDWELGGDYQHTFADGSTLTTLFIYSSSSQEEAGAFSFIPVGGVAQLDEVQIENALSVEKILRSSYQWELAEAHQFESGVELAINTVDEDASLLLNRGGVLREFPLFNEESTIEETRYEAFTSYTWQASDNILLESSLDLEYSTLQQTGNDVTRDRNFFYPRPRAVLRYDLDEQTQLRGRVERTISQLDFGAFIASFTNDDNRFKIINAGNPELEPEKTWEYAVTFERQLPNDMGVFSIEAQYADVTDHIARLPLQIETDRGVRVRTAPGNIGDGYMADLEINNSLRLDWLNLDGAVLDVSVEFQRSRIEDPITGREREFNFSSDYELFIAYRQDLSWNSLSWGVETFLSGPRAQYDYDYWQESEEDPEMEFFVEIQPLADMTLRLEAENLVRTENQRERYEYVGNRGSSALERRELRNSSSSREVSLSLQWAF